MSKEINFDELVPKLDGEVFDTGLPSLEEETTTKETVESTSQDDVIKETVEQNENNSTENTLPTEKVNEETNTNADQDNTPATLFYQELIDNGIVAPSEDKEEYSWDDVSQVINNYKEELPKKITEELVASAPDLGKDLIDFVFTKGQNLKPEDLNQFMSQYISDIQDSNTEFNDVSQARSYLENKYKEQSLRESQIEVMLDALEDEGEEAMFEEAKKYKEKDIENSKSKQLLEQSKEQNQAELQRQREFANTLSQELENTGWKPNRINKIREDLVTGRTNELLSKAGQSPKALIQLANLATYFDEKSGNFNFEDFIKQAISPEARSLKDKITKDMFSTGTNTKERSSNPNKNRFSDLVPISPI